MAEGSDSTKAAIDVNKLLKVRDRRISQDEAKLLAQDTKSLKRLKKVKGLESAEGRDIVINSHQKESSSKSSKTLSNSNGNALLGPSASKSTSLMSKQQSQRFGKSSNKDNYSVLEQGSNSHRLNEYSNTLSESTQKRHSESHTSVMYKDISNASFESSSEAASIRNPKLSSYLNQANSVQNRNQKKNGDQLRNGGGGVRSAKNGHNSRDGRGNDNSIQRSNENWRDKTSDSHGRDVNKQQSSKLEEMDLSSDFLLLLEENKIYTLKKKTLKFPKAKFFCRLCDYHLDLKEDCDKHIIDSRHCRRKEINQVDGILRSLPKPIENQYVALTAAVEKIYEEHGINELEQKQRADIVTRLEKTLKENIPDVVMFMYGSSLTGFGLKTADINVDLKSSDKDKKFTSLLKEVHVNLKDRTDSGFSNVRSDFAAKVPSLLLMDELTGLTVNIAIHCYSAHCSSELLSIYSDFDIRVRKLAVAFRYWAHLCGLDRQHDGFIPPQALNLMVIYFLQIINPQVVPIIQPPKVTGDEVGDFSKDSPKFEKMRAKVMGLTLSTSNSMSVGELWLRLLKFYSLEFDTSNIVVSIRNNQDLLRHLKPWNSKRLAVEDPYMPKKNITRMVNSSHVYEYWQDSICKALYYFGLPRSLGSDTPLQVLKSTLNDSNRSQPVEAKGKNKQEAAKKSLCNEKKEKVVEDVKDGSYNSDCRNDQFPSEGEATVGPDCITPVAIAPNPLMLCRISPPNKKCVHKIPKLADHELQVLTVESDSQSTNHDIHSFNAEIGDTCLVTEQLSVDNIDGLTHQPAVPIITDVHDRTMPTALSDITIPATSVALPKPLPPFQRYSLSVTSKVMSNQIAEDVKIVDSCIESEIPQSADNTDSLQKEDEDINAFALAIACSVVDKAIDQMKEEQFSCGEFQRNDESGAVSDINNLLWIRHCKAVFLNAAESLEEVNEQLAGLSLQHDDGPRQREHGPEQHKKLSGKHKEKAGHHEVHIRQEVVPERQNGGSELHGEGTEQCVHVIREEEMPVQREDLPTGQEVPVQHEDLPAEQELLVQHEDLSAGQELLVQHEDLSAGQEEVTVQHKDLTAEQEEVTVQHKNLPAEQEEVTVQDKDLPAEQEVLVQHEDLPAEQKVLVQHEDLPAEQKVLVQHEDLPAEQEVLVQHEDLPAKQKVLVQHEDLPAEQEVLVQLEDLPAEQKVLVQHEDLPAEQEVLVQHEDLPAKQKVLVQHEDLPAEQEVLVQHEDLPSEQEVLVQHKDLPAEQEVLAQHEDLLAEQEEVTVQHKDLPAEQEVLVQHKDLPAEQEVLVQHEDLLAEQEEVAVQHEDLLAEQEEVTVQHKDLPVEQEVLIQHEDLLAEQEVLVQHEDLLVEQEEVTVQHKDLPAEQEVLVQHEDLLVGQGEVTVQHKDLPAEQEVLVQHEDLLAEQEVVTVQHEDLPVGQEEVIVQHEDLPVGQGEVIVQHEDLLVGQGEVTVQHKDLPAEQEVLVQHKDLPAEQEVLVQHEDLLAEQEEVAVQHEDLPVEQEVLIQHEDLLAEQEVLVQHEDLLVEQEEVTVQHKDLPAEQEVLVQHEDLLVGQGEVTVQHKDLPAEQEVLVQHEDLLAEQEVVTVQHEDLPVGQEEVIVQHEDLLVGQGEVIVQHEDLPAEQEEVTVQHEDLPAEQEEVTVQHEDLPAEQEEVIVQHEDLPAEQEEVTVQHEDLLVGQEEVIFQNEDLLVGQEEVIFQNEDLLVGQEEVIDQHEDLPAEQEEGTVQHEDLSAEREELTVQHEDLSAEREELTVQYEDLSAEQEEVHNEQDVSVQQTAVPMRQKVPVQNKGMHDEQEEVPERQLEVLAQQKDASKEQKMVPVLQKDVHEREENIFSTLANRECYYEFSEKNLTDGKGPALVCAYCDKEGHLKNECPEDELPEISPLSQLTPFHVKVLSETLNKVPADVGLSEDSLADREMFMKALEEFIQVQFRDAKLALFGSTCNGFGFDKSDMDICLTFTQRKVPDKSWLIENLARKLKQHVELTNVQAIPTAKVPIVKFTVKKTDLEGDISLYNVLAQQNTKLLLSYSKIDPRVCILGYTIKTFAKVCDIGDASRGSLSSYAYILMMLYYLQQVKPPVIPVLQELYKGKDKPKLMIEGWDAWFMDDLSQLDEFWPEKGKNQMSVAELWLGFLCFYVEEFKHTEYVVSIRQKEPLTRFEKLWNGSCIAIEDPFDLAHNLGSGLTRKMNNFILKTFINGRMLYGSPIDENMDMFNKYQRPSDYFFDTDLLSESRPPNVRGCRRCGKIGHLVRHCPAGHKDKEEEQKRLQQQQQHVFSNTREQDRRQNSPAANINRNASAPSSPGHLSNLTTESPPPAEPPLLLMSNMTRFMLATNATNSSQTFAKHPNLQLVIPTSLRGYHQQEYRIPNLSHQYDQQQHSRRVLMPAATAHPSMSYMPQSPLFNSALPRHNMTHFNYAPPRTQNAMFYQPGNPQTSPSYGGWNPQNNNHNGSQSGPQYSFYGHDGSNIQGMSPRFHNTFASTKGQVFDTGFNQPHRRK